MCLRRLAAGLLTCVALHNADAEIAPELGGVGDGVRQQIVWGRVLVCRLRSGERVGREQERENEKECQNLKTRQG